MVHIKGNFSECDALEVQVDYIRHHPDIAPFLSRCPVHSAYVKALEAEMAEMGCPPFGAQVESLGTSHARNYVY